MGLYTRGARRIRTAGAAILAAAISLGPAAVPAHAQEAFPVGESVELERVADGLASPVYLVEDPRQDGRLLIVDQAGTIEVYENGQRRDEPFLDLSEQIVSLNPGYDERGLLGLALHPDFENNGRLFVYYSAPRRAGAPGGWDHTSHLSEFGLNPDGQSADPATERIVLHVDQPQGNHNAGHIAFGPDGYLYVPLGDGGGAGDVGMGHPEDGHGQDRTTLLGSILRIDVDTDEGYEVPADNPFVDQEGAEEIWAYGLRNPYAIAFERGGNRLFAADAGQALFEEVNLIERGQNYGWNIKEGTRCFDPDTPTSPPAECPDEGPYGEPLVDPIVEYERGSQTGTVIVGGRLYTGTQLPFQDEFVFADYSRPGGSDGVLYAASPAPDDLWSIRRVQIATPLPDAPEGELGRFVLAIGEDNAGELYVLTTRQSGPSGDTGEVYRIVGDQEPVDAPPPDPDAEPDDAGFTLRIPGWIWAVVAAGLVLTALAIYGLTRVSRPTT